MVKSDKRAAHVEVAELAHGSPWPFMAALIVAVCAAAYARTLAPGITWANHGLDSGELIAAAVTAGVPHPTGYPTYLLLARALLLLPADPALAVTLLSPIAATLAALTLGDLARRWCAAPEPWASAAGLFAALSLALAPLFWSQAVIAEVYALSTLGAALLLRAAMLDALATAPPPAWRLALTGMLAGAALGAHVTTLPFALLWAAAQGLRAGPAAPRAVATAALWACAGLLVYLYLPLAARADPPISWGDAASWSGFWWLVSGQLYAGLAFGLPAEQLGPRLATWAAAPQLGWAGLALAAIGVAVGGRPCGPLRWAPLAVAALAAAFALGYNTDDAQVHRIPAILIGALYAGLGAGATLAAVDRRRPALAPLAALALGVALYGPAPRTATLVDASDDRRAISYAEAIIAQAPPAAVLIADSDRTAFPLWYYHFARGERADLRIVTEPLLGFRWYRESLRATYTDLPLPDAAPAGWEAALAARYNAGPICRVAAEPEPAVRCR